MTRLACRFGLHFMTWSHQLDGYACHCRNQYLWAEQIRSDRNQRF